MKKLLVLFTSLFLTSLLFAEIKIQQDASFFGGELYINTNHTEPYFTPLLFNETSGSILWQFDQNEESKISPFAGVKLGLHNYGFPIAGVVGLDYSLYSNESAGFFLRPSLAVGTLAEIFGDFDAYIQPSLDFIIQPESISWLYGGIGITSQNLFTARINLDQKKIFEYYGSIYGHFIIGVRI